MGRQRNDRTGWVFAGPLSDGGCIEADITGRQLAARGKFAKPEIERSARTF